MRDAVCTGKAPNLRKNPEARDPWFPRKGESTNDAKIACFVCPVREDCKDYAKRTESTDGVWGGEVIKKVKKDE